MKLSLRKALFVANIPQNEITIGVHQLYMLNASPRSAANEDRQGLRVKTSQPIRA